MAESEKRSFFPTGALFGLLLGAVVIPAVLAISVGIVSLAFWRQAVDIVVGVLVLCFAAMALTGGIVSLAFLRRSSRLAEMQTDFIANVSHELRTPVAGIKLLAETLALGRAPDPAGQKQVLTRIMSEVRRLEDLVARILTWRRVEAGAFGPRSEQSIADLLADSIAAATESITSGHTSVTVDIAPEIPPIWGDRDALLDTFRNLVNNAVKFGGPDKPVEVSARHDEEHIIVTVRDYGPGIPPSEWKRIFERFYRAPMPNRSSQGTGLGLAIVRRVVESHGGQVTVDSEPGKGSEFTVKLPYQSEEIAPEKARKTT